MYVPCSRTPAGPKTPGHYGVSVRPSVFSTTSRLPRQRRLSRLNHTARTFAVYASQRRLLHRHARLASGCWPALPGGVGYPLGSNERFQPSTRHPPSPGFAWRNENSDLVDGQGLAAHAHSCDQGAISSNITSGRWTRNRSRNTPGCLDRGTEDTRHLRLIPSPTLGPPAARVPRCDSAGPTARKPRGGVL